MSNTNVTNLSPIFLTPLLGSDNSFIKSVGSGTGLGKTYSSILALDTYIDTVNNSTDPKNVLAIFTAPQHNQISFPDKLSKSLENKGTSIIKVKPSSGVAQSNIDSDTNAYETVKILFFNGDGKTKNAIHKSLLSAARVVDNHSKGSSNPTRLEQTLVSISFLKFRIDGILGKLDNQFPSSDDEDLNYEQKIAQIERQQNYEEQQEKLVDKLKILAKDLQLILLNSYKNPLFYNEINNSLSPQSLREFREVTATFYPFLHYQLDSKNHSLMGMTVSKMLTKMQVFSPKYVKSKNILRWGTKLLPIEDIIDGGSNFCKESRETLQCADADDQLIDLAPHCRKLFDTEIHLYIDESDSSKKNISDYLNKNLEDRGIIQASGSLSKELGNVLYDDNHQPLIDRIPDTDIEAFRYLTSGIFDDSIARQVGKDILRKIQDSIIQYVISSGWCDSNKSLDDIDLEVNNDIQYIARAMLIAPYCTVESGIDRNVFEVTSAFGGEMFGFIGSRYIDQFVVTATSSSIRITEPEYLHHDEQFIPLKSLFLLITINWFIFLCLSRRRGGDTSDEYFKTQITERVNALLSSEETTTACHQVESLKKFIRKLYDDEASGIRTVAKPFRQKKLGAGGDLKYHTECAFDSIVKSSMLGENYAGVFSPMNVKPEDLVGESTEYFIQDINQPIDIKYGYCKANTIFGMAQFDNTDYMIADDKMHVVFPIKYRRESAESYLAKLVSGQDRRVCCFLMSATGSFENSHIPAWSMSALEYMSEGQNFDFYRMNRDDYGITAIKQLERGSLKNISFNSSDDFSNGDIYESYRSVEYNIMQELKANEDGFVEGIPNNILYHLESLSNRHKRTELNNILKGLDYIHNNYMNSKTPIFSLALAQTHLKFSAAINAMRLKGMKGGRSRYRIDSLLSMSGSLECGIYRLSTQGGTSRFDQRGRDTLVICYSTKLDKVLSKIYREQVRNPNSNEYKLKEMLGMQPERSLADTTSTDFNAINYLLNNIHDCNVFMVSAYQSAARGVNLIVNKKTQHLNSNIKRLKKSPEVDNKLISDIYEERDLDFLFMAAPPYYSEIRLNLSNSMTGSASQERYFARCDRYFHYLEWLSRKCHTNPELQCLNSDVDLMSPVEDADADEYFYQQHAISVFSALQQALGRIERTNFHQHQTVFLCQGVNEVISEGIDAITEGHDDASIDRLVGAMSVVNSQLIHKVRSGELDLRMQSKDNSVVSIETQCNKFENLKRETFLKAIAKYRSFDDISDADDQTLIEIEFYEAFRSTIIWTEGYSSYIAKLDSIIERMPKGIKRNYKKILKLMFSSYEQPLDEYISISGRPLDLSELLSKKEHASTNPYVTMLEGSYIYPSPWFLPDLEGNYGELVTSLAIDRIINSNNHICRITHHEHNIARKGYELADFFVKKDNQVVAIDAKNYSSLRSQFAGRKDDYNWTLQFNKKLQRYQERLSAIDETIGLRLAAINTSYQEFGSSQTKTVGIKCYLINSNAELDFISSQIVNLLSKGGK